MILASVSNDMSLLLIVFLNSSIHPCYTVVSVCMTSGEALQEPLIDCLTG